jgi:phage terminase Nu1 subunit (DNA packaging protein)
MEAFEEYVGRKELQKHFKVSARTVARWMLEECPCIRIGTGGRGDPRFRISKVESWLDIRTEVAKR